MDRFSYRIINTAQDLAQSFPGGQSADAVVISIYNIDTSTMDVTSAAMTYKTGVLWTYSWTPSLANTYQIDYFNPSTGVHFYEYVNVVGVVPTTPGSSTGSTQLSVLRSRFLQLLDNYNANDLTGINSSGALADLCLNNGLQIIYSMLKASRYLENYGSTALVSTANQSYIELSAISDLDEVIALKDTSNQITLQGITAPRYFREIPDPSKNTGIPFRFCRIFNRVYLDPRPTAAITYTCEYRRVYPILAADSDTPLLPTKFDDWIYKEARVQWYMMEDIQSVPPIVITERNDARDIFMADALTNEEVSIQASSYVTKRRHPIVNPYDHLI